MNRTLLALRRYAQAEGWTYRREVTAHGPITIDCREWHHGDLHLAAIVHDDSVTVSAWRRKPGHDDDPRHADIVHLPSATPDVLARVLVAVGLLPPNWRRIHGPTQRPAQLAGQLELMPV